MATVKPVDRELLEKIKAHYKVDESHALFIYNIMTNPDYNGDIILPKKGERAKADTSLIANPFSSGATVDLHLPGKHNQKDHGRRIGREYNKQEHNRDIGNITLPKPTVTQRTTGIGTTETKLTWGSANSGSLRGVIDSHSKHAHLYGDSTVIQTNFDSILADLRGQEPNLKLVMDRLNGARTIWRKEDASVVNTPSKPSSNKPLIKRYGGRVREVGEKLKGRSKAVDKAVKHATTVIAKVHSDGVLPKITVTGEDNLEGAQAVYITNLFGRAKLKVLKTASNPEAALVHEIGHLLDNKAFGGTPDMNTSSMGSERKESREMDVLMQTIDGSPTVRKLKREKVKRQYSTYTQYLNYLDTNEEKFARAYAQWIALRSGDEVIRRGVRPEERTVFKEQWPNDEFGPIANAFDQLFRNRGWLR